MPKTKYIVSYKQQSPSLPMWIKEFKSKAESQGCFDRLKRNGRNPVLTKV